MVKVPTYDLLEVAPRPGYQQGVDVRASADAFGAGIGQGMQDVGQGLGQAAEAVDRYEAFKANLQAKDAQTAFERDVMQVDYGPNGYLTTQGRNAVDRLAERNKTIDELKRKYSSGLTGRAAQAFDDVATQSITSSMRQGLMHSAQGAKDWAASTSVARLDTLQNQALTGYKNPETVAKSIAAGALEIRQQAELMGWGADVVAVKEREFSTKVFSQVALAMAGETGGASRALDYLKTNGDHMDAATRLELEAKLKPYANDEKALGVVNGILGRTRSAGPVAASDAGGATVAQSGPTVARQRLYARAMDAGKGPEAVDGMRADFAANLDALFQDAPPEIRDGLQIGSGFRSVERQAQLFADAVQKYGSEAAARKWVAPPGGSQHNQGQAVDIWYKGQRLDSAPAEVRQWVHDHAADYGLRFPMSWESWHIEPANARGGGPGSTVVPAREGVSARASMPSYDDAMAQIMAIEDLDVRASAMKQLNAQFEMRSNGEAANQKAAAADIWSQVAQGVPMSQIPLDLKIAAGREAVEGFQSYEDKAGKIVTDPKLFSQLTMFAATDPVAFSKVDLTAPEVINGLSKEDLKSMVEKQGAALTDQRNAREEGLNVSQAMGWATMQLEAVGITQTGLKGDAKAEAAKRQAEFQMALLAEMEAFKAANNGKAPTQPDIMSMTNKLLLPIVIKTPRSGMNPAGWFGNNYSTQDGLFAFEAGSRPDGTTVDVVVKYEDIPLDLRRGIAIDLERELGRKPSEEEVIQRYEDFTLSR